MVKRIGVNLLAMVFVAIFASVAFAQAQDPREAEARKDCLSGKCEAGITLLAELFAESGNSNFVYNQARCYEQNARPDEAIQRFREYLRIARNLGADEKSDVDSHIAECRAMKAEQDRDRSMAAGTAVTPAPSVVPASAPAAAAPVLVPEVAPPPSAAAPVASPSPVAAAEVAVMPASSPESAGTGLRTWGVVAGSVGVVAVGAGVVFSLLTSSTKKQVESDGRIGFYDPNKDARGRTYSTMQWVGYGVGAGTIAASAVMFLLGSAADHVAGAQPVAILPAIGPGQGGALLQGSF